jgi:hypothetical protein
MQPNSEVWSCPEGGTQPEVRYGLVLREEYNITVRSGLVSREEHSLSGLDLKEKHSLTDCTCRDGRTHTDGGILS